MARSLDDSNGNPAGQSNEATQSSNGSESCSGVGSGSGSASASASGSDSEPQNSEPQNSGRTAPAASTPLKQPPPPASQPSEQHQNPPPSQLLFQPPSRQPFPPPLHTTASATTTAPNHSQKPAPTAAVLPHRPKTQKHVVGGGGSTARLHARVPSSKALFNKQGNHNGHNQNHNPNNPNNPNNHHAVSSTKLAHHRRQPSFSPPLADLADRFPFAAAPPINASSSSQNPHPQQHRRATSSSDAKLTRHPNSSSASSLVRKNVSSSSLKRNRSHADVVKRNGHGSRPTAQLKRANSNPAVAKTQPLASAAKRQSQQVHFEIGSPDAQEQDDEWVDAGSSTLTVIETPNYNRLVPKPPRNGNAAGEAEATGNKNNINDDDSDDAADDLGSDSSVERRPLRQQKQIDAVDRGPQPSASEASGPDSLPQPLSQQPPQRPQQQPPRPSSSASTLSSQHRTSSTSKLLMPRTPPRGALPMMSTETALASMRPDSSSTDSSPPKMPRLQPQIPGGSSERDAMTSRFITGISHESGSGSGHTGGDSYYTTSSSQPSGSMRHLTDDRDAASSSNTNVSVNAAALAAYARGSRVMNGGEPLTDDEDASIVTGASRQPTIQQPMRLNGRRTRPPHAPPAELSRTQQKLNLERASSGLDRNNRQHAGPSTGALLGAGGFGTHDPRIVKLMEKTGMEYYVVRRYQNPVTRSLGRLTDRLGGDRNWRIPAAGNGHSSHRSTASDVDRPATASEGGNRSSSALSQSFRERDIRRDVLQHATSTAANAPLTLARTRTFPAAAVAGGGLGDSPAGAGEHSRHLSGASLVDSHGDDEGTAALLRNLWEKNLYLGTSQD